MGNSGYRRNHSLAGANISPLLLVPVFAGDFSPHRLAVAKQVDNLAIVATNSPADMADSETFQPGMTTTRTSVAPQEQSGAFGSGTLKFQKTGFASDGSIEPLHNTGGPGKTKSRLGVGKLVENFATVEPNSPTDMADLGAFQSEMVTQSQGGSISG